VSFISEYFYCIENFTFPVHSSDVC